MEKSEGKVIYNDDGSIRDVVFVGKPISSRKLICVDAEQRARDDARIARLEDVAKKARFALDHSLNVYGGGPLLSALNALAALGDADAPGGG